MLRQLLVGIAVSACNIGIHALVMTAVVWVARRAGASDTSQETRRLIAVMIATVSVLMLAHISEVIIWSLAYAIVDAAPAGADPALHRLERDGLVESSWSSGDGRSGACTGSRAPAGARSPARGANGGPSPAPWDGCWGDAGRALAAARTDDGDERRSVVWLVNCCHFRSAAKNSET